MNDADRLCRDPAMRWVVGDRAIIGSAASASQMGRFETKWLSRPENFAALAALPGQWIDGVHNVLQDRIGYLLKRPVGRPPHEVRRHFASFGYQAKSWKKPRRVVAKIE